MHYVRIDGLPRTISLTQTYKFAVQFIDPEYHQQAVLIHNNRDIGVRTAGIIWNNKIYALGTCAKELQQCITKVCTCTILFEPIKYNRYMEEAQYIIEFCRAGFFEV